MNFITKYSCLIAVFLVLFARTTNAQIQAHFEHLTIKDGLSHSIVFSVAQDKKGFIWMATGDGGVNKYDGYRFTVFEHDPNNLNSVSSNNISKLICDSKGNIWIGTWGGGLDKYDPVTEKFTHYKNDSLDPQSISHNNAQSLLEDSKGNLWVGTAGGGLNKMNISTGKFTVYKYDEKNEFSLANDRVWSLAEDKKGNIWVGTGDGLCMLDIKSQKFTRYPFVEGKKGGLSHPKVRAVHIDKKNRIWVGTTQGLDLLDVSTGKFTNYKPYPDDLTHTETNEINVIYSDRMGGLWVGTHAGGLCSFNTMSEKFTGYRHEPNDEYSISYNDVRDIIEDRSGILWIATRGSGVNKFDLKPPKFMHFSAHPENPDGLKSNRIRSICSGGKEGVWLGLDGGGVSFFNLNEGTFKNYFSENGNGKSLSTDRIRAVFDDGNGKLFIGTEGGGLNVMDIATGNIKVYIHDADDSLSIFDDDIRCLAPGPDGKIWIGMDKGLDLFDPQKNYFEHFTNRTIGEVVIPGRMLCIFTDSKNITWIGTEGGLLELDLKKNSLVQHVSVPGQKHMISNNFIYCVAEDKNHDLWIGTARGLNFLDRESKHFKYFTDKHGLPGNTVYSILPAENGEFWISTISGLARYNPEKGKFRNYYSHDGLQSDEFLPGSGAMLENGYMFFGGINGFNVFHPGKVMENTYLPQIVFTSISIFNTLILLGENSIIRQSVNYTDEITLSYDQNEISFSFAALSYNVSEENQYAYMLVGYDDDWIMAGTKHEVNYTNLPPGEYVFKVKACNNDGAWNEEGISMKITITPPFWQTIWFYCVCGVVLLLILFAFIKWREQKLTAANKILEDKVTQRTEKINEQNKVLNEQREELEHKHRDIMDSIKYAKRIQEAILPPSHVVEENIKEHFVLYKPKDIVSGDFYWTEEFEGKVLIAAVDCTGHGVPGAFVSIVGSNGLNRAVNEFKLTQPALILDKLNFLVTDSLHQDETASKDGMDMALCCIDRTANKVLFSGANNSLYVVSSKLQAEEKNVVLQLDDNRVMYELKADKQPIGGTSSYKQTPFTNHEIEMVKNDMIYLFTDGFADQFGGPKGKKYKYSQLFKLLAEISLLPMDKQRERLNTSFEEWKMDLEQIDDVCVIGIRI